MASGVFRFVNVPVILFDLDPTFKLMHRPLANLIAWVEARLGRGIYGRD